jgi:hypothetical protein
MLTVISFAGRDRHHNKHWNVRCECGEILVVQDSALRAGQKGCRACAGVRQKTRLKKEYLDRKRGRGMLSHRPWDLWYSDDDARWDEDEVK